MPDLELKLERSLTTISTINAYVTQLRTAADRLHTCSTQKIQDTLRNDEAGDNTSWYQPARLALSVRPIDDRGSPEQICQNIKNMFISNSNQIMIAVGNTPYSQDFCEYWLDRYTKQGDIVQSTPYKRVGEVTLYHTTFTNAEEGIKVGTTVLHIPTFDVCPMNLSKAQASLVVQVMMDYLSSNKTLFIHCAGGIGRTGNVFIAILAVLLIAYPNTAQRMFPNLGPITDLPSLYEAIKYCRAHIRPRLAPTGTQLQDACKLAALMLQKLADKTANQKTLSLEALPSSLTGLRELLTDCFQNHTFIPAEKFQQLQQQAKKLIHQAALTSIDLRKVINNPSFNFATHLESVFKELENAREIIKLFNLLCESSPKQNIEDLHTFFDNKMEQVLHAVIPQVETLRKEYYRSWYDTTHFNHAIVGPCIKAFNSLTTELSTCYKVSEKTQDLIKTLQSVVIELDFLYFMENRDQETRLSYLSYSLNLRIGEYEWAKNNQIARLSHLSHSLEAIKTLAKNPANKTQFISRIDEVLNQRCPNFIEKENARKYKEKIFTLYAFVQSPWILFKKSGNNFDLRSYGSACFRQFIFPLFLSVDMILTLVVPIILPLFSFLIPPLPTLIMIGISLVVLGSNHWVIAPALLTFWDKAKACFQLNFNATIGSGIVGLGLGLAVGLLLGVFFPPAWIANLYIVGKIGLMVAMSVSTQILASVLIYKITASFQDCFDNIKENSQPDHALPGGENSTVTVSASSSEPHAGAQPTSWSSNLVNDSNSTKISSCIVNNTSISSSGPASLNQSICSTGSTLFPAYN